MSTTQAPPVEQDIRTHNVVLTRDYCCAQCYGRITERITDRAWRVSCPRGCQPGGFVTLTWASQRRAESIAELAEVAHLYPQFDTRPKLTDAQRRSQRRALYGEE